MMALKIPGMEVIRQIFPRANETAYQSNDFAVPEDLLQLTAFSGGIYQ